MVRTVKRPPPAKGQGPGTGTSAKAKANAAKSKPQPNPQPKRQKQHTDDVMPIAQTPNPEAAAPPATQNPGPVYATPPPAVDSVSHPGSPSQTAGAVSEVREAGNATTNRDIHDSASHLFPDLCALIAKDIRARTAANTHGNETPNDNNHTDNAENTNMPGLLALDANDGVDDTKKAFMPDLLDSDAGDASDNLMNKTINLSRAAEDRADVTAASSAAVNTSAEALRADGISGENTVPSSEAEATSGPSTTTPAAATAATAERQYTWSPQKQKECWSILHRLFKWPYFVLHMLVKFMVKVPGAQKHVRITSTMPLSWQVEVLQSARSMADYSVTDETYKPNNGKYDADEMQALRDLHNTMQRTSMSSAFSGVDTPATSFLSLGMAVVEELGLGHDHLPMPPNLRAIEWYSNSQEELLHHPHPPDHVFGDISAFWIPSVAKRLPHIIANNLVQSVLVPLVLAGGTVSDTAFCIKHGTYCKATGLQIVFAVFAMSCYRGSTAHSVLSLAMLVDTDT